MRSIRPLVAIAVSAAFIAVAGPARAQTDEEPVDDTEGVAGIGVAPSFLTFEDTLRGSSYTGSIVLSNGLPGDRRFTFATAGDIQDWISFADTAEQPIDEVVIPHQGSTIVQATVTVPDGAANGSYSGRIEVSGRPVTPSEGDSAADLSIGAIIAVNIEVGGEMNRAGSFDDVIVDVVEVGQPLVISAVFNNTGNVGFDPTVNLTISRAGQPVDVIDVPPEQTIDPGRAESIDATWDTTDTLPGDYEVEAIATAEGYDFAPITAPFRIEQPGSVERSATLESLDVVSVPELGGIARVRGILRNDSDIAVQAVLVAEVERDGTLVGELRSLEILAAANNTTSIDVVVEDLEAASYVIRGKVNYEGRETRTLEASFSVAAAATESDSGTSIGLIALLAAAALGLILIGVVVARARSRRSPPRGPDDAGSTPARPRQPEDQRELTHR